MSNTQRAKSAPRVILVIGPFADAPREIALDRPMTIAEVIERENLAFRLPTIAVMSTGGEPVPVLRKSWHVRMVGEGEVLAFVAVPGRGGNAGKSILGLVASIALTIAAPFVGAGVAGALGLTAGTVGFGLVKGIASVAFLAGGSLLLNAVLPKPKPADTSTPTVYSASAASNQATPLDVMPCLYGRLRFAPRFQSASYSEYQNNDQYLYQLMFVSLGKVDLERIEFGDTTAWRSSTGVSDSFDDLTVEIVQPGDDITLFPANVVTSTEVNGQTVPQPGNYIGPFVINAADTTINSIAVDFAFPAGLYTVNDKGETKPRSVNLVFEYQEVDGLGDPIGGWNPVFSGTFTLASRKAQRYTRRLTVPAGRYQVRCSSTTNFHPESSSIVDVTVWMGLRGYLTDFVTPPNCTLLALRIKASQQSSALADQIFVTGTRWLPVWNGSSWVEQATSSIAWAAADLLRNVDYGLGLSEAQFDLSALATLDALWTTREDTFNGIFDRRWVARDALAAILRAGRAQPTRIGGKVGFVRDQSRSLRRAMFTPRNVVRGSFQHKLVLFDEDNPDHAIGQYLDETVWKEREVTASLASVSSDEPERIDLFGITNHAQAWRETIYETASNAYRREFCSFTAEWEGKLLTRGDPVIIQHPFIEGVAGAGLLDRDDRTLTVDTDLEVITGADAYVIIRGKDGREWGPCLVESQPDARTIVLDEVDLAAAEGGLSGNLAAILPDDREERAHVVLCEGETRPMNALIVSASPSGKNRVNVLTVIDAPEVYAADETETMPSPWVQPTLPPLTPTLPTIQGLFVSVGVVTAGLEVYASWQASPGANLYVAEISYDDGESYEPIYSGANNGFTAPIQPQGFTIRVAAIGSLTGPWSSRTITDEAIPDQLMAPGVVSVSALNAALNALVQRLNNSIPGDLLAVRADLDSLASSLSAQVSMIREQMGRINIGVGSRYLSSKAAAELALTTATTANSALAAIFGDVFASSENGDAEALFRFAASSAPEGVVASIALEARATVGDAFTAAGIYIDVGVTALGGASRIRLSAGQILFEDPNGVLAPLDATFIKIGGDIPSVPIVSSQITPDLRDRRQAYQTLLTGTAEVQIPLGLRKGDEWGHYFRQDPTGGRVLTFKNPGFITTGLVDSRADYTTYVRFACFNEDPPNIMATGFYAGAFNLTPFVFRTHPTAINGRTFNPLSVGQVGDLMVAFCFFAGYGSTNENGVTAPNPNPSVSTPAGWAVAASRTGDYTISQAGGRKDHPGSITHIIFKRLTASDNVNVSPLGSGGGGSYRTEFLCFTGGASPSPIQVKTGFGSGAPSVSLVLSTEQNQMIVVAGACGYGTVTNVTFPTFTASDGQSQGANNNCKTRIGYKIFNTAPSDETIAMNDVGEANNLAACALRI